MTDNNDNDDDNYNDDEPIKCWDCKQQDMVYREDTYGRDYYICLKCNPLEHRGSDVKGCLNICCTCQNIVPFKDDEEYICRYCWGVICVDCCILVREDDNHKIEKDDEYGAFFAFCDNKCQAWYDEEIANEKVINK